MELFFRCVYKTAHHVHLPYIHRNCGGANPKNLLLNFFDIMFFVVLCYVASYFNNSACEAFMPANISTEICFVNSFFCFFFSLIGIYGHMELLFAIHKHVCVSCQLSCICLFSYSVSVHLCRHNCEGSRQKFRARMFFAVSPRRFSVRGLCTFFHLCFLCMIRFCNIRMKELLSE